MFLQSLDCIFDIRYFLYMLSMVNEKRDIYLPCMSLLARSQERELLERLGRFLRTARLPSVSLSFLQNLGAHLSNWTENRPPMTIHQMVRAMLPATKPKSDYNKINPNILTIAFGGGVDFLFLFRLLDRRRLIFESMFVLMVEWDDVWEAPNGPSTAKVRKHFQICPLIDSSV